MNKVIITEEMVFRQRLCEYAKKKGVIKAKGKGSCYIYITANSGVYTKVKVTVK